MIVVAIIGLLAAIAIPGFVRARAASQQGACINNLRQVDYGKSNYAIETGNTPSALTVIVPTYVKRTPTCPASGTYAINALGTLPTCSIGSGHTM